MEFVEAAHTHLISRYDPHPEVFAPKTPYSYNPTGGAKFLPKLSPQTLGSPTIEVVSRAEQTAKAKWHKGGWDAVNSPPQKRGFGDENAAAPMVMRGGWPADGVAYSRVTGDWYSGEPPAPPPPKANPTYAWQQQKFLRPTA